MSRFYQDHDAPRFDYQLFQLPGLADTAFRGPRPPECDAADVLAATATTRPILCLGAAQTFGRFVDRPFPQLLTQQLGRPVWNLAVGGCGPRHYLHPDWQPWLQTAPLVILQVVSGLNAANSRYDDHDHALQRCGKMRGRRRADATRCSAREILAETLRDEGPARLRELVEETRQDWLQSMRELLAAIPAPTLLLWFSTRRPRYREDWQDLPRLLAAHPHLVTERMLRSLRPAAAGLVRVSTRRGLPEPVFPSDQDVPGAERRDGMIVNHHYPSAAMHRLAFSRLARPCRRLLGDGTN